MMMLLYIPLAILCYIFVAWTMHVDRARMVRFMATLALFMSVLLMSRVYRELWTPYILIFWPYEFGVMLYVCDSVTWPISIKRIGICLLLAAIGLGAGETFVDTVLEGGWRWLLYAAVIVVVPVLLTGGVKTVADAERLLTEGKSDLIGVGRALFKDAHWRENN
jgi:hypothetical protein